MDQHATVIVVPCYNEADRLQVDAFARYAQNHSNIKFMFVNDGSSDGTERMLTTLCAENPEQLRTISLDRNRGKAEAVRAGFLAAFDMQPDLVAFWDADLATPLSDIDIFVHLMVDRPECMAVFGSRVNLLGRRVERKLMRHYIGRVFATAAATVLRLSIYDTQCGAKMFRVNDLIKICFAEPFLSRWIFDVEIVARMRSVWDVDAMGSFRSAIYEHPLMVWNDVKGSKLKPKDFITVALDLMRIATRYGRTIAAQTRAERS